MQTNSMSRHLHFAEPWRPQAHTDCSLAPNDLPTSPISNNKSNKNKQKANRHYHKQAHLMTRLPTSSSLSLKSSRTTTNSCTPTTFRIPLNFTVMIPNGTTSISPGEPTLKPKVGSQQLSIPLAQARLVSIMKPTRKYTTNYSHCVKKVRPLPTSPKQPTSMVGKPPNTFWKGMKASPSKDNTPFAS